MGRVCEQELVPALHLGVGEIHAIVDLLDGLLFLDEEDLLPRWTVDCAVKLLQRTELRAGRAEDDKRGPRFGYPLIDLLLDATIRQVKSCS